MTFSLNEIRGVFATIWRLRPQLRGGRYLIAAVMATSILAALLEGLGVSLLVPLLSLLLGGEGATPMRPIRWLKEALPGHDSAFYVLAFAVLVLLAILLKNVTWYISQVLATVLRRRISINLRNALFERLHNADLHLFEQSPAGEISNIFFTETHRTFSLVDYLLLFVQRASMGLFYLGMLFFISWQLTLITLGLAGLIGLVVGFMYRRLAQSGQEITQLNQQLSSCVQQSFAGIRVVRTSHAQAHEIGNFARLNEAQARSEERASRTGFMLVPVAETVAVAGAMVIVGCAYYFFVRPGLMLSSYLLGFGFILLRTLPLLNQLYGLQGHLIFLARGVSEVLKWLGTPIHPNRPFGVEIFSGLRDGIGFENVSYTYPSGRVGLKDVSFKIPACRTVAVVGASGSGKSTVANLLLRFRQPDAGRVVVDGRDYWSFTAESWHRAIAVVEQEAFLFHDTMANNIAYGYPEATAESIRRAVREAHLDDLVNSLPDGLNTPVGERGTMLSGGQRQRLAIARALVRNPQILILDEATAALDTISERHVQVALEQAVHGRTVLVIAHRLSTIRNAGHIVVLEQGAIVEQGTWEELSARQGAFARLLHLNATPGGPAAGAGGER